MSPPILKTPAFYLALAVAVLAALLISEIGFKRIEAPNVTGYSAHRPGKMHFMKIAPEIWKTNLPVARSILIGRETFYHTSKFAPEYVGDALSCTQCHYDGGQYLEMLGLVGVAPLYPRYDARSERTITLAERIQSCFLRSENGKAPSTGSPVLKNLVDYVTALSSGQEDGDREESLDFVKIAKSELIPIESLSPARGKILYRRKCAACHLEGGQGDLWAPPLWGSRSFNDGAGLARVYTLASYIKEAMPLSAPAGLSTQEAQELAAYINSHERPVFAGKDQDYPSGKIPVDAVYYTRRYPKNPLELTDRNLGK